jgi:SulP family sulfate permease
MLANLRRSFQPKIIFPSLTVGLVTGIQNAILVLALAVMIFGGELNSFISIGISVLFVGCFLQAIVVALGSSLPGMITMVQDSPAVIMALVVAAIVSTMPDSSPETKLYTSLAAIMITTVLSGAICLLLGKFKLGNLVSYLPYPVIGGFLAGTGMLLAFGAFQVMTGRNVTLLNLAPLFQNGAWMFWLPGVIFATSFLAGHESQSLSGAAWCAGRGHGHFLPCAVGDRYIHSDRRANRLAGERTTERRSALPLVGSGRLCPGRVGFNF